MTPARREGYGVVLTAHVFDKVRSIDMTLAEFEELLGGGEVIEETWVHDGVKELVLDDIRREERIVTVYEPDGERWSADFKVRKP